MSTIRFSKSNVTFTLSGRFVLKEWLKQVAKGYNSSIQQINYIFCTDDFLYQINVRFLNHHTLTDIITFDYSTSLKTSKKLSGEIYISIDRVKENALQFKSTFQQELYRVMIHGLLHLCGFKDHTAQQKKRMRIEEDKALALLSELFMSLQKTSVQKK